MNRVDAIPFDKLKNVAESCLCHGDKYYILFMLGVSSGLRVSDILSLKVNIVMSGKFIVIEKKTGKKNSVVLDKNILKLVRSFTKKHNLSGDDYLIFNSSDKRKAISRNQASKVIKAAALNCNLQNISAHSMRKTYSRLKYNQCHDILEVQKNLNHSYMSTTLLYLIDDFSKLKL